MLSTQDLLDLKEKLEADKKEKAKNEGILEQIEKDWEDEYDCKSEKEVKNKVKEIDTEIEGLTAKRDKYIIEIEEIIGGEGEVVEEEEDD